MLPGLLLAIAAADSWVADGWFPTVFNKESQQLMYKIAQGTVQSHNSAVEAGSLTAACLAKYSLPLRQGSEALLLQCALGISCPTSRSSSSSSSNAAMMFCLRQSVRLCYNTVYTQLCPAVSSLGHSSAPVMYCLNVVSEAPASDESPSVCFPSCCAASRPGHTTLH